MVRIQNRKGPLGINILVLVSSFLWILCLLFLNFNIYIYIGFILFFFTAFEDAAEKLEAAGIEELVERSRKSEHKKMLTEVRQNFAKFCNGKYLTLNFSFCRVGFGCFFIAFYFSILDAELLGGVPKLGIIKFAGDFKPANRDLIPELIDRGTRADILSVNAATRYWAACEAVKKRGHPIHQTLKRFDLAPTTTLLHPGRMSNFASYLPTDWGAMQRCDTAVREEPWRSNFPESWHYEDSD